MTNSLTVTPVVCRRQWVPCVEMTLPVKIVPFRVPFITDDSSISVTSISSSESFDCLADDVVIRGSSLPPPLPLLPFIARLAEFIVSSDRDEDDCIPSTAVILFGE